MCFLRVCPGTTLLANSIVQPSCINFLEPGVCYCCVYVCNNPVFLEMMPFTQYKRHNADSKSL